MPGRRKRRRLGFQSLERRNLLAAKISELLVDPLFGENDTDQMVELRGEPESTLDDGTYLLVISERGTDEGKIHGMFDLSGQQFGSNGYLVLLQQGSPHLPHAGTSVLQSTEEAFGGLPGDIYTDTHPLSDRIDFIIGANTYLLVQSDVAPLLGTDVDAENDGEIDEPYVNQWDVLDSISLHPYVGRGDIAYGDIVFAETGSITTEIDARDGVEVVFTEGFGYAGRVGESVGTAAKDWVMGTVQDETRNDDEEPPRWALVDNLFGVPSQYPFSGRDLDHVGEANFVGGVRGFVTSTSEQIDPTGVTILADTNGNGVRDNLTFSVEPDDVVDRENPLDEDGNPKVYPLINAFPGVTITNFSLESFPAQTVTAELEDDFPNTLDNRIFAKGGIDWFSNLNVLRFDFYRPVNAVSIVAIGHDNPLSLVYGRLDAFNAEGDLIDFQRSSLLRDSARETISVSSSEDDIAYVYAYTDELYLDGGPFGRFDSMSYSQLEPAAVTDENGFYEIENLFPGEFRIMPISEAISGPSQPIVVDRYENFEIDFELSPNSPPSLPDSEFTINENSGVGSIVGTLQGSDPDGQAVNYRFADENSFGFELDSQTGQLTVGADATLNFEQRSQYEFDVVASDSRGAETSASVTVTLRDLNERPSVDARSFPVPENAEAGTLIGAIPASDPDTALNQTLQYSVTGGTGQNLFNVHPTTGVVTVKDGAVLDHETADSLSLDVRVSDGGSPELTDAATITILVSDENESPEMSAQVFQVSESAVAGGVVGVVTASDPDDGQTIRYSITGGTGADRFLIGDTSGRIQVRDGANLDHETDDTWTLRITARDSGSPALATTVEHTIEVLDADEPPAFISELTPTAALTGSMYDWSIPVDSASDPEGDEFEFDIAAAEGDLPTWLEFDSETRALSGVPSSAYTGELEFVVHVFQRDAPELASSISVTMIVDISATPLHNTVITQDVNADNKVTANDALRIINYLALPGSDQPVDETFRIDSFFDVTGDNLVTALDALRIINEMARRELSESEWLGANPPWLQSQRGPDPRDSALEQFLAESSLF